MLRVFGAGLPRTGTSSLKMALERLLGGPWLHMTVIEGHPFDLGEAWRAAIAGGDVSPELVAGFVASVDWPAPICWRQMLHANPDAIVLLARRVSPLAWWQSLEETILP